ncbi:hypothetical protein DPMN_014998 [Dreissena polymorpha]|uniref:Uncharacterized protein n=1 Tax=Dreissena polymorpha TaxID=45954 RepID=A0A9D4S570_DREPO|nr:hypothetical protein DPMN_014998 [Dreissena polymorpha]
MTNPWLLTIQALYEQPQLTIHGCWSYKRCISSHNCQSMAADHTSAVAAATRCWHSMRCMSSHNYQAMAAGHTSAV